MSLIICKNKQDEDDLTSEIDSINKPYAFRNSITSNMMVPANAEIALQSAKINMDGSIIVGGENSKLFYNYVGMPVDPNTNTDQASATTKLRTVEESPFAPIKVILFPHSVTQHNIGIDEIADEITQSVNEIISYPNLKNRFKCSLKTSAGVAVDPANPPLGKFEGFTFTYNQRIIGDDAGQAPQNVIPQAHDYATSPTKGMLEASITQRRNYQVTNGAYPGSEAPLWTYTKTTPASFPDGMGTLSTATTASPNGVVRTNSRCVIGNVPPVHCLGGKVVYFFEDCLKPLVNPVVPGTPAGRARFQCGLSRGSRSMTWSGGDEPPRLLRALERNIQPFDFKRGNGSLSAGWMGGYMDYGISYDHTGSSNQAGIFGRNNRLLVFHTVVNTDDIGGTTGLVGANRPLLKRQQLRYGNGTAASGNYDTGTDDAIVASAGYDAQNGYNLTTNPLNINAVEFKVENCRVTIDLIEYNTGANPYVEANRYVLVNYDPARNHGSNLKCINQNCLALLPAMTISNRGNNPITGVLQELSIVKYESVQSNWSNFDFLSDDGKQNDFYNKVTRNGGNMLQLSRQLDRNRDFNNYTFNAERPDGVFNNFVYPGITSVVAEGNLLSGVSPALVVRPSVVLGGKHELLVKGANMGLFLGFPRVSDVTGFIRNAATFAFQVSSYSLPTFTSSKSVFVRLENFGQESVNSFQGLRSKIIAHLPRFDGQNSEGPLYLEPNERMYLDLKNPQPFRINSFDISLCYADETYATSLTGTTIICLHIREKS